ncbi:ribokinase [Neorhizobium sp. NCHU2750]|uniref:ribokinase n=1 Tax=Neorhizobium sp. NCHU2750 TaxID=1825976 RepID=UPI000E72E821|nr:ribokinase [Neorhizobium sp. NCHU2750]
MNATSPAVVTFGSLHYDIIVKGPARPRKGETVTGSAWHPACGGKGGNQAVSAARQGVPSAMIGAVADDQFGSALLSNLDRYGVDRGFVRTIPGIGSGMSVAIFDSEGDYGAVIVSGSNLELGEEDVEAAKNLFRPGAILVLQNEVPDAANVLAAAAMKKAGGRVILNAAPARKPSAELEKLVDIVVVNAVEAEALSDVPEVNSLDSALAAARTLSKAYPVAVVTAGGDGVACVERDSGKETAIPAIKVQLVSTHGAGDEFIGVLAAQLLQDAPVEAALMKANEAAAILVSKQR